MSHLGFLCPNEITMYTMYSVADPGQDGDMLHGTIFDNWLNSPAHHTLHHLLFHYNMGQYFVWADRYWGTEKLPMPELDPLIAAIANMKKKGLDEQGRPIAVAPTPTPTPTPAQTQTHTASPSLSPSTTREGSPSDSGIGSEIEEERKRSGKGSGKKKRE